MCLAAFGRRFGEETERTRRGGSLREECIAGMYVLMLDPAERCTGTKRR